MVGVRDYRAITYDMAHAPLWGFVTYRVHQVGR